MPHPLYTDTNHTHLLIGPQSLTVVYLEQFIHLVLSESLLFFTSGVELVAGGSGSYTPTLESCQQVASQTELNNRFMLVCSMVVDWIVHAMEPMSADHAQFFKEGATIPKYIAYDRKAELVPKSAGFVRFILQYFCRALLVVIKKVIDTIIV